MTKIFVNYGDPSALAPSPWNNVTTPGTGLKIPNLLDENSNGTGKGLNITVPFSGILDNGVPGTQPDNYPEEVTRYPFWTSGNARISFTGFQPFQSIILVAWAQRTGSNRTYWYSINGILDGSNEPIPSVDSDGYLFAEGGDVQFHNGSFSFPWSPRYLKVNADSAGEILLRVIRQNPESAAGYLNSTILIYDDFDPSRRIRRYPLKQIVKNIVK